MKTLWTIISILALTNLLAIVGLLLWLKSNDRLDGERVQRIREILSMTIAEEKLKKEEADKTAADEKAKADAVAKRTGPSRPATEVIDANRENLEANQASLQRLREEIKQLQQALAKQQADVQRDREIVEATRKRVEAKEAEINKVARDQQFQQALAALEAQKAPAAKQVLQSMLTDNKREEALDYLAAMDETKRAKIMTEFIKTDERLAAELLEQLRTRGITQAKSNAAASGAPAPSSAP